MSTIPKGTNIIIWRGVSWIAANAIDDRITITINEKRDFNRYFHKTKGNNLNRDSSIITDTAIVKNPYCGSLETPPQTTTFIRLPYITRDNSENIVQHIVFVFISYVLEINYI
jgi:hypothetical protein